MSALTDKIKKEIDEKIFMSNVDKKALSEILTSIAVLAEGATPSEPDYKVYKALLTQLGTDEPTAIVLQNTFEEVFSFSYESVGKYGISKPTPFVENKTTCTIVAGYGSGRIADVDSFSAEFNVFNISTFDTTNAVYENDVLGAVGMSTIEIIVYN